MLFEAQDATATKRKTRGFLRHGLSSLVSGMLLLQPGFRRWAGVQTWLGSLLSAVVDSGLWLVVVDRFGVEAPR